MDQLAKAEGLRVISVTGSDEKVDWLVNELGLDAAINCKSDNLAQQLADAAPDCTDLLFENTGDPIQNLIFEGKNAHGRIIVCGIIATMWRRSPVRGQTRFPLSKSV